MEMDKYHTRVQQENRGNMRIRDEQTIARRLRRNNKEKEER